MGEEHSWPCCWEGRCEALETPYQGVISMKYEVISS